MSVAAVGQCLEPAAWGVVDSARGILSAFEKKDLGRLDRALHRAGQLSGAGPGPGSSLGEEQLELLEAVTGHIRNSIGRLSRGVAHPADPLQIDLRLLRHLSNPVRLR